MLLHLPCCRIIASLDSSSVGRSVLQNSQPRNPRRRAANPQRIHTLFMQQIFIFECSCIGNSMRSKQMGHRSSSGLSWPLAISSRFCAAPRSASARAAAAASDMIRRDAMSGVCTLPSRPPARSKKAVPPLRPSSACLYTKGHSTAKATVTALSTMISGTLTYVPSQGITPISEATSGALLVIIYCQCDLPCVVGHALIASRRRSRERVARRVFRMCEVW